MHVTIDKAGRVVIPKSLRERHNMYPGASMEIESGPEGVLIRTMTTGSSLIRKEGVLIHHGSDTLYLDPADLVNREREQRNLAIVAENPSR